VIHRTAAPQMTEGNPPGKWRFPAEMGHSSWADRPRPAVGLVELDLHNSAEVPLEADLPKSAAVLAEQDHHSSVEVLLEAVLPRPAVGLVERDRHSSVEQLFEAVLPKSVGVLVELGHHTVMVLVLPTIVQVLVEVRQCTAALAAAQLELDPKLGHWTE